LPSEAQYGGVRTQAGRSAVASVPADPPHGLMTYGHHLVDRSRSGA
jgi:hypothetical protein